MVGTRAGTRLTPARLVVAAADALCLFCVVLAASIGAFSGLRLRFGSMRLQVDSPWLILAALGVLLFTRHTLQRTPSLPAVAGKGLVRLIRSDSWQIALLVGATSRITIWLVALFALTFNANDPGVRMRAAGPESPIQIEDVFMKWDGGWYVFTAEHGYLFEGHTQRLQNVAFFPAYPLLMRTVGSLLGARVVNTDPREGTSREFRLEQERRLVYAGLLISCIAFVWALRNLRGLTELVADANVGTLAVLLVAWYPFAVFYGAVYTESLFLAGLTGVWFEITRDRWGTSALWGLLIGFTRPVGFLVAIPIAIAAFKRFYRPSPPIAFLAVAVGAPLVGAFIFSWYMRGYTGHWLEWVEAQAAWNRFNPDLSLVRLIPDRIRTIWTGGVWDYIYRFPAECLNASATIVSLSLVIPIGRRLGIEYAILTLTLIGLPLFAGGFMTMGRFAAPVFPVFMYLASLRREVVRDVVLPVSAALQALVAALHVLGKPLY